jgi:hypothetical protein
MWPWRDWVIRAFNSNLPFDQFLTWQLAGDLLPNATKEQRLATAFNRLHMQNEEGGVVEEEFRVAYVVDRVTTAGTAFLGLTFECSRCHDHKYDPITQRDFYSLFAFFQNIDESGQTSYFTDATPTPAMLLSSDEQDAKLAGLRSAAAAKEKQLAAVCSDGNTEFERWLASKRAMPADVAGMTARFTFDEPPPPPGTQPSTQPVANAIDPKHPGVAVEGPRAVEGRFGKAAELSGENGFTFPASGDFQRADPFSLSIWLQTPSLAPPRMVVVHKSKAPIDAASRGYELLLENGRVAFGLHYFWPGNSLKVVTKRTVSDKKWTHVAVTYDGSSRADGVRIYIDGEPAEFDIVRDGLSKDIRYGGKEPDLAIGYRFRDNGFKGGKVDDFRIFNRAVTPLEVTRLAGKDDAFAAAWNDDPNAISLAHRDALREYFFANVDAGATKLAQDLTALRRQENELATSIPEAMVMREMPTTKPAFVLERGSYDKPKEPVSAATPAFLPSMPKDQPRNRLGLARWMLADDNPLTSRVVVNRVWQQMFGRGIVETTENFGTQGAQPTHPELLDWLAREFSGPMHWDTKRLLKTIAMSATYRQSSLVSSELLSRDPANTLLARGPVAAAHGGDAARPGVVGQRPAGGKNRRAERQTVPAGRHLGRRDGQAEIRHRHRRGALSPLAVHLLEAQRPAAVDDDVRRGGQELLYGSPPEHEHAASGAGAAQRHAGRRGGAVRRAADARGRRRDDRCAHRVGVPRHHRAHRERSRARRTQTALRRAARTLPRRSRLGGEAA